MKLKNTVTHWIWIRSKYRTKCGVSTKSTRRDWVTKMNEKFKQFIDSLEPSYQELMRMRPVTVPTLPQSMPPAGVYLFSEGKQHLYVGRTNSIRKRLQNHCRPSSGHNVATFAFRLARNLTGQITPTYTTDGSRKHLQSDPNFNAVFTTQKERVRNMDVRYISEKNPMHQALLEMYISVCLCTPYNDFDNH